MSYGKIFSLCLGTIPLPFWWGIISFIRFLPSTELKGRRGREKSWAAAAVLSSLLAAEFPCYLYLYWSVYCINHLRSWRTCLAVSAKVVRLPRGRTKTSKKATFQTRMKQVSRHGLQEIHRDSTRSHLEYKEVYAKWINMEQNVDAVELSGTERRKQFKSARRSLAFIQQLTQ